ncbi:hypothetical protein CDG77_25750 [Nostoc sp. 'Peltigera membranacea cyanobiont' 213]|uniref:HBL/NHE enterotoxin family protein n=1 Tax=Nostoc sp. 'Peltigera membranacea cyanobiont' 213 TaxID=2014530 RepID=UPI000B958568|nr:HBL/NHE enterotoxin family protein [Nostoc sp. 'Peltigera membranacea cyanobiont' 213]OYD88071.1 hypothetical protein CDG77_25750 [Nostoc sp. 'Peltigera membranacea cyanobiont' 213]
MVDKGLASIIFTPDTFKENNKPLLTPADWHLIQLSLNDFINLPITKDKMPYETVLSIYQELHESAVSFHDRTLPKSYNLAGDLYGYGKQAQVYFQTVVKLLDADTPHWDSIQNLLGKLRDTTTNYRGNAKDVYDQTKDYGEHIASQQNPLKDAVKAENEIIYANGGEVKQLNNDIQGEKDKIDAAQTTILKDQQDIKNIVYYAWVWPIGSIVAITISIDRKTDIRQQQGIINQSLAVIHDKTVKIETINRNTAQMTTTVKTNRNLQQDISSTLPLITKIQDAWNTIYVELDKAITNINTDSDTKPDVVVTTANLTTAVNEWHDVANDAHDYMMNFHIVGIEQASDEVKAQALSGLSSTLTN